MRRFAVSIALVAASLASIATSTGEPETEWTLEETAGQELVLEEHGLYRASFEIEVSPEAIFGAGGVRYYGAEVWLTFAGTADNVGSTMMVRHSPDYNGELNEREVVIHSEEGANHHMFLGFEPTTWACSHEEPCIFAYEMEVEHVAGPAPGAASWELIATMRGGIAGETELGDGATMEIRILEQ